MKCALFLLVLFVSEVSFAQIENAVLKGLRISEAKKHTVKDTIPFVIFLNKDRVSSKPFYYLNGAEVHESVLQSINPDQIKSLNIEKDTLSSQEKPFRGIIRVETKPTYTPKMISLNEIKEKYIKLSERERPTVFILDGQTINDDYDLFLVDEKYILKMEVQEIDNGKEGLDILVVKLLSRTKENLKKVNTIILRGDEKGDL